jgi:hypothetical protein
MVMPMSERDTDFPAGAEITDTSRSTAEFRAFANPSGSEAEQPWSMRAPVRKIALLAAVVVVVAIVLAVIAVTVLAA